MTEETSTSVKSVILPRALWNAGLRVVSMDHTAEMLHLYDDRDFATQIASPAR